MDWIIFCMAGLFVWMLYKHKQAGKRRSIPHKRKNVTVETTAPRWRDPLDDIDPDTVVYNGHKSANTRVRMRYTDGQGRPSEREVEIKSYDDTTGIGMFEGFCHLRGARRSFYFARVAHAIDVETGEIIDDLRTYLNTLWEQSTGPALRTLRSEHGLALEVMQYVGRADKSLRAPEPAIITQYCKDVTGDQRLDTSEIRKLLDHTNSTTLHGFKIKLTQLLNNHPSHAPRVAQECRAIVATQKTVHPDEQAALDYLDRKFPPQAASQ